MRMPTPPSKRRPRSNSSGPDDHAPAAAAFAALIALALPASAQAEERIASYSSDVRIQKDGALDVTETIEVNAEGVSIRHGIYRDFPTTRRVMGQPGSHVGFKVLDVRRERRRRALRDRGHQGRRPGPHRLGRQRGSARRSSLRHPLPDHSPDRPFRGLRRALLERNRQWLGLPDRPGRGANHPPLSFPLHAQGQLHRPRRRDRKHGAGQFGRTRPPSPSRPPLHWARAKA